MSYADAVIACADLVGRAGASSFEMGWTCPHVPDEPANHTCPDVTWHAHAQYQGARIMTAEHPTPATAATALAERLLTGATCRCRRPVALSDDAVGCRWKLVSQRWEPGCQRPTNPHQGSAWRPCSHGPRIRPTPQPHQVAPSVRGADHGYPCT